MGWHHADVVPPKPGVYRVQIPVPYLSWARNAIDEHFARWTGHYWTCWTDAPGKAAHLEFRGPTAGYIWASTT